MSIFFIAGSYPVTVVRFCLRTCLHCLPGNSWFLPTFVHINLRFIKFIKSRLLQYWFLRTIIIMYQWTVCTIILICPWLNIILGRLCKFQFFRSHLSKAIYQLFPDLHHATILVQAVWRRKIASLSCSSFPHSLHIHQMLGGSLFFLISLKIPNNLNQWWKFKFQSVLKIYDICFFLMSKWF